ncbi:hypothetical protein GCM10023215_38770 [Pseudonocardia yuanmonensis]|uniref:Enoyl-CoA hydratase/isomerase-like protein n=1 Tax=Pseudonocardia yuanmonensis TaxID=1095914 RepID=A0ABP8WWW9_9PSEU
MAFRRHLEIGVPMSVRVSGDRTVPVVTIDRPDKLNALDYPTIDALRAHLDELPRTDGGGRSSSPAPGTAPSAPAPTSPTSPAASRGVRPWRSGRSWPAGTR